MCRPVWTTLCESLPCHCKNECSFTQNLVAAKLPLVLVYCSKSCFLLDCFDLENYHNWPDDGPTLNTSWVALWFSRASRPVFLMKHIHVALRIFRDIQDPILLHSPTVIQFLYARHLGFRMLWYEYYMRKAIIEECFIFDDW